MTDCLGVSFLGLCQYSPSNPEFSIISFGDSVAIATFLIAFTQLLSLTKKEVINESVRRSYKIGFIAILIIFFSSLLPLMSGFAMPLIGYPIFWEFIGSVLLLYTLVLLVVKYHSSLRFNDKDAEHSLKIIRKVITKGSEEDYLELAEKLEASVPDVVTSMRQYDRMAAHQAEERGEEFPVSPRVAYSFELIRTLADPHFCRAIVRRDPAILIKFLQEFKEKRIRDDDARTFVSEIVSQALRNKDSFLYREEAHYKGLGLRGDFTKSLFLDYASNERLLPLSYWMPSIEKDVDEEVFKMFCRCYYLMFHSSIKAKEYNFSFSLYPSKNITGHVDILIYRLDKLNADEIYNSYPYKVFKAACQVIEDMLQLVVDDQDANLIEMPQGVWNPDGRDESVFARLASSCYELFKSSSKSKNHEDEIRFTLWSLWQKIYVFDSEMTNVHRQVQLRFEALVFKKLKVNLEEGYYPAISRTIFLMVGVNEAGYPNCSDIPFRQKFFAYVRMHFPKLYAANQARALDKLPKNIVFDVHTNELIHTDFGGNQAKLAL